MVYSPAFCNSINKYDYRQPITSSRINYKGVDEAHIHDVLEE